MSVVDKATPVKPDPGPKYEINIEGTLHFWNSPTISVPELRQLAGIPSDQPMLEVDLDTNVEQTLAEDAVVHIKPGKGFAKKVRYQRG
jgi:hypothetical protein